MPFGFFLCPFPRSPPNSPPRPTRPANAQAAPGHSQPPIPGESADFCERGTPKSQGQESRRLELRARACATTPSATPSLPWMRTADGCAVFLISLPAYPPPAGLAGRHAAGFPRCKKVPSQQIPWNLAAAAAAVAAVCVVIPSWDPRGRTSCSPSVLRWIDYTPRQ